VPGRGFACSKAAALTFAAKAMARAVMKLVDRLQRGARRTEATSEEIDLCNSRADSLREETEVKRHNL
jgi:hypothetical protein